MTMTKTKCDSPNDGIFYVSDKHNDTSSTIEPRFYGAFTSYKEAAIYSAFHHDTPVNGMHVTKWAESEIEYFTEEENAKFLPATSMLFPDGLTFEQVKEQADKWLAEPNFYVTRY